MTILEITNLHKVFNTGHENEVQVLKGIDLEIRSSDFFSFRLPS